jgi:hypothetical protein
VGGIDGKRDYLHRRAGLYTVTPGDVPAPPRDRLRMETLTGGIRGA